MRFELRSLLLVVALSFGGCTGAKKTAHRADAGGHRVLAVVNGTPITEEKFLERVRSGGAASIARAKTKTGRLAILDSMIRNELLWQEAQRRGLRRHRMVRDAVNPLLVKAILGEEFEKTVKMEQVDERNVAKIYRDRWDEFHFPETFRLGVMRVEDVAFARTVMRKISKEGKDQFKMIASGPDNLEERFRASEGNIGYLSLEKMREVVPAHLLATFDRIRTTKDVPEIVETPQGVYVVMMTGRRDSVVREYEEVHDGLRQQAFRELREQRLNEFVASFSKKHDVETHHDRLDTMPQYTVPPPGTLGPGGTRRRDAGPDGSTASADGGPPEAADGGSAQPSPAPTKTSKRP